MIRDIFVGKAEGFWDYYKFHNFMVSRRDVDLVGLASGNAGKHILEVFHAEPGVTVVYQKWEGGEARCNVRGGGTDSHISEIEIILHNEAKKYEARSTVTQ